MMSVLKRLLVSVSCAVAVIGGLTAVSPAPASAAPGCADVHVLFARGTVETAPPLGLTGIAFEQSLRNTLRGKSVRVEAVDYRAAANFRNELAFAQQFVQGVKDQQARTKQIAAACPDTDIVLGGYSQGAALTEYTLADEYTVPAKYSEYRSYLPTPLPDSISEHVSAVVLFGPPSDRFLRQGGAPSVEIGKAYRGKTTDYCAQGDNICNGASLAQPNAQHLLYPVNGMTDSAARYVARHV
nr:cutinase family protein [Gordonia zhaorongruii]